ncbi:MAG: hypothetical protein ABIH76_07345 [Candidatus Bathyarchaeota archaeon]
MNWKVVSFYTKNYTDIVATLIKSLDALAVPYDIEMLPNKGSWKLNTFQKIPFIIKKLKQYNSPLVWLDADAEVIQYPKLFDSLGDSMMAGVYSPLKGKDHEFISNAMYFAPTKEVFGYLNEVNKFIKDFPHAFDQKMVGEQFYMQSVLEKNDWKGRLKFKELPYTYGMASYWEKSQFKNLCKEPYVIKQYQASRTKDTFKMKYYQDRGLVLTD